MSEQTATVDTKWPDFARTKLKWVQAYAGDLGAKYPDQWVCIYDGEVIAAGTCGEAHQAALGIKDREKTLVMLVEGEGYVY